MNLSQQEWTDLFEITSNKVLLDVRTEEEVDQGMIPNAIHIDFYKGDEFMEQMEALDKSKSYFVYCRSGIRSEKACDIMHELGIENAYNLMGGIIAWEGEVI